MSSAARAHAAGYGMGGEDPAAGGDLQASSHAGTTRDPHFVKYAIRVHHAGGDPQRGGSYEKSYHAMGGRELRLAWLCAFVQSSQLSASLSAGWIANTWRQKACGPAIWRTILMTTAKNSISSVVFLRSSSRAQVIRPPGSERQRATPASC